MFIIFRFGFLFPFQAISGSPSDRIGSICNLQAIGFLRGHVSQISEKLAKALPPSEEEIKTKHWWQFWR
jgi:hypothetical protein